MQHLSRDAASRASCARRAATTHAQQARPAHAGGPPTFYAVDAARFHARATVAEAALAVEASALQRCGAKRAHPVRMAPHVNSAQAQLAAQAAAAGCFQRELLQMALMEGLLQADAAAAGVRERACAVRKAAAAPFLGTIEENITCALDQFQGLQNAARGSFTER